MSILKKLAGITVVIGICFGVAMLQIYNQSKDYFDYAESQFAQGNYTEALKGMNKLEMRREEVYLGGYQQVLESWESALGGIKPKFYETAKTRIDDILLAMDSEELLHFIEVYVELDIRYVPEATLRFIELSDDQELVAEMEEFLNEAFPLFNKEEGMPKKTVNNNASVPQGKS